MMHKLVRGVRVDILKEMIRQFLFDLVFMGQATTIDFDYYLRMVRSRRMMQGAEKRVYRV